MAGIDSVETTAYVQIIANVRAYALGHPLEKTRGRIMLLPSVVPVQANGTIVSVHMVGDLHRDLYHRPGRHVDYWLWRRARKWVVEDINGPRGVERLAEDYREIVFDTAHRAAAMGRRAALAPLVVDPDLALRYLIDQHYGGLGLPGDW